MVTNTALLLSAKHLLCYISNHQHYTIKTNTKVLEKVSKY